MPASVRRHALRALALLLGVAGGLVLGAAERGARGGDPAHWLAGDLWAAPLPWPVRTPPAPTVALLRAHGAGVARWLPPAPADAAPGEAAAPHDFGTDSALFDQEWSFGTLQMAALGYAALAERDPAHRALHLGRMERCLTALLGPSGTAFDRLRWGHSALDPEQHPQDAGRDGAPHDHGGHAAWLGYTGLALARHRALVGPDSRFAAPTAAVARALRARFASAAAGVPETYPGERYPVDAAAGIAALAVLAQATGQPEPAVDRWRRDQLPGLTDPATGLLVQAVDAQGAATDGARGSGTLLAAWFLGVAGLPEADQLAQAADTHLATDWAGFGTVREVPRGAPARTDIDSGPVIWGQGVSATGFGLGVALQRCQTDRARALQRTAETFGAPETVGAARHYAAGGPIGDAILFAMLTSAGAACGGAAAGPA